jgi:C-terminal processing protease CtpA/Prc
VVINRGTFSSAMLNAIQLDDQTNATLLGEPTGGKPNSYGEILSFPLPHFGLSVVYSTKYFELRPGSDAPSVFPHVAIPLTASDYFAGIDPVLSAFAEAPKRRRASTGR